MAKAQLGDRDPDDVEGLEADDAAANAGDDANLGADEADPGGLTPDMLGPEKPAGEDAGKKGDDKAGDKSAGKKAPPKPDKADKDKPPAEQPAWDKDRQRRDQEHATERRAFQGQLEAATEANRALADEIKALRRAPGEAASAAEAAGLEAALAKVDALSEASDPADVAEAMRALKRYAVSRPKAGIDADRVAGIEKGLAALTASVQEMGESIATRQGRDALEGTATALDEEFGAKLHNDAMELAGQMLMAEGRSLDDQPTLAEKKIALRAAYLQLARGEGGKPKPKPSPKVAADAGKGGGVVAPKGSRGRTEDVLADMRREGKVR
ncbi:MAG TPA: hypothetical protein VMY35_12170 [Phycisphaerae bacterium]|nr:hypothetical protein [Phycisphaerae bacterium]